MKLKNCMIFFGSDSEVDLDDEELNELINENLICYGEAFGDVNSVRTLLVKFKEENKVENQ